MQLVVRGLLNAVGHVDTIKIVRRWGGRTLYVPRTVKEGDPFSYALGLESASKLCAKFGGQYLQIPRESDALIEFRNEEIIKDHRAGVSITQIGYKHGLCRQSVSYIIRLYAEREAIRKKYSGHPIEVSESDGEVQLKLLLE